MNRAQSIWPCSSQSPVRYLCDAEAEFSESAKLMSTESWKVFLECEAKDVDCIPMVMYKGVQWCQISSENRGGLSDRGSEGVMWFATICD